MKKKVFFSILFAFSLPACLYALGLGEMKVESALEQPFLAEVKLIDVRGIDLSNIRVGIADQRSYQSLGVERPEGVDSLLFEIRKNSLGKYVVVVYSRERITEPYMQLIIDLIWSKGQIYKVYTVLLDPPGYKLESAIAQSGLTYQRKFPKDHQNAVVSSKTSYNKKKEVYVPKVANENVWQIAQRYKTSDAILPQIVLAIVGANPDAFTDGNLNGLKAGVHLKIPATPMYLEVPADLATVEVMAHDKAWNEKTVINHVLSPPYMIGQASQVTPPVEYSQIPPVPKFSGSTLPAPNQIQPEFTLLSALPSLESQKQISPEQSRTLNAEISITSAAVDSLRESNTLLMEQLNTVQAQNKKLQKQLDKRDKELVSIHKQIQTLLRERIAIAGQTNTNSLNSMLSNFESMILLLLIVAGAGSILFYYFKRRDERTKNIPKVAHPLETKPILIEPIINSKEQPVPAPEPELTPEFELKPDLKLTSEPKRSDSLDSSLKTVDDFQPTPEENKELLEISSDLDGDESIKPDIKNKNSSPDELSEENLLEFESGLYPTVAKEPAQERNDAKEITNDDEKGLEFVLPSSDLEQNNKNDTDLSNLKNKKALDTLLALAKTYIGMEDIESALNSLDEVLEHGSESQKEEARRLLAEIKGKS